MTLVRSLRPLLSGNKFLAVLSAFVLISCNAFKVISNDRPSEQPGNDGSEVVENDLENVEEENSNSKTESKKETKKLTSVEFFGQEFQVEPHKTEFKVALILPFYYNASTQREKRTSNAMVEYYQGVKMALSDLENEGLRLKLYVYDTENRKAELKRILDKSGLKQMDVIVGPISKQQIEMVSSFGLKHDIPVISPFTGMDTLTTPNKLLYCTTPSMATKAQKVVDFINENHPDDKVIILNDGRSYAKKLEPMLVVGFKKAKTDYLIVDDQAKWGDILTKDENTVVYVISHNATLVSTTLSKIYQTKQDVTIFGENSWSNFEDNDYKFWNKLNIHLIASDFVNDTMASVKNFRQNFRLVNRKDPGVYSYLGYDQFKFMGDYLMAFGEHFPMYINNREFRYLGSNFKYQFTEGANQNTNVFILKFEEFELRPVE